MAFQFTRPGDTIAPPSGGGSGGGMSGGPAGMLGGVFSGLREKAGNSADLGGAPMTDSQKPFDRLGGDARQQLLQSMLMRARGGQPGGAPNAPLPTPNSNVPGAILQ